MSVVALVPARGGSKGIPLKNIKLLAGIPLIKRTIQSARNAKCIDRIVVTTDDEEIACIARMSGADVPFMRPQELATDNATTIATTIHAIEQLPRYDWVLLLQPTSPLRSSEDIDGIFRFCIGENAPAAASVTEVREHPYLMYTHDAKTRLKPFIEGRPDLTRRQDFAPVYLLNGALYLAKTDWLLTRRSFIGTETVGYVMPAERSVDLDTLLDWQWAEFLIGQSDG